MVLSPQCFHNLRLSCDIFNHANVHFWEYMQPGYDALGFISCTGTTPSLLPLRVHTVSAAPAAASRFAPGVQHFQPFVFAFLGARAAQLTAPRA